MQYIIASKYSKEERRNCKQNDTPLFMCDKKQQRKHSFLPGNKARGVFASL